MPQHFNDSPIERREDDRYGIHTFAEALATSLCMQSDIHTAVAASGICSTNSSTRH